MIYLKLYALYAEILMLALFINATKHWHLHYVYTKYRLYYTLHNTYTRIEINNYALF
jgi:hypothetical protein